jgi:hypothetical protein
VARQGAQPPPYHTGAPHTPRHGAPTDAAPTQLFRLHHRTGGGAWRPAFAGSATACRRRCLHHSPSSGQDMRVNTRYRYTPAVEYWGI